MGVQSETHSRLEHELTELAERFPGRVGYSVTNLVTGERYAREGDAWFQTASAIKLPVLTATHRSVAEGRFAWDDVVQLDEADMVGGSGILQHLACPREISYRDAATLMILLSDNVATNVLLAATGMDEVNRLIADECGAGIEVLGRAGGTLTPSGRSMGRATPNAFARYLDGLAERRLSGAEETYALACEQFSIDAIPRDLPTDALGRPALEIAHKPGTFFGVRTDVGIMAREGRAAAVAFMIEREDPSKQWARRAAEQCIGALATRVYEAWLGDGT